MARTELPTSTRYAARALATAAVFLTCLSTQAGTTVYKHIDANGTPYFTDRPPTTVDPEAIEVLSIDPAQPSDTARYQAELNAIRETTDRMAADRREREKHRAELRALQAHANPPQPTYVIDRGYPVYGRRWGGGYWPPLKPRPPVWGPDRPSTLPAYPTSRARASLIGNQQLMRPIGSRSVGRSVAVPYRRGAR